jgi:cardiolipin synthase
MPLQGDDRGVGPGVVPYLERAMDRAAGCPRTDGNALTLQFEGSLTFESWLEAIDSAERFVHFENYIVRNDPVGRAFREALCAKAREGVEVRLIFDWVGCWATPRRYWKPYRQAGVEVRAFNRPSLRDPFGVLQRDHRKLVCVDGKVAYVGGLCVGVEWAGSGDRPPWRDTGVELRGPAAAAGARAFERIWEEIGAPVPEALHAELDRAPHVGRTPVWLIEGVPWRTRVYRVSQLVASVAQKRIWITDPYFVAPRPVSDALVAAARGGVDVRILVPGRNNWPLVGSLSRGGYRALLSGGVRIFEWQGPMIHAKTSVADGVWCRIGSSNLNAASLLGNWEIDVGVFDAEIAGQLEGLFVADLASSVEIELPGRPPAVGPGSDVGAGSAPRTASLEPGRTLQERLEALRSGGRTGWRIADVVRAGSALGDAIAGHRILGREDRTVLGTVSAIAIVVAVLGAVFPRAFAWAIAFLLAWLGMIGGVRALVQARQGRKKEREYESSRADGNEGRIEGGQ